MISELDIEGKTGVCQGESREKGFPDRRKLCTEDLILLLCNTILSCRGGSGGDSGT